MSKKRRRKYSECIDDGGLDMFNFAKHLRNPFIHMLLKMGLDPGFFFGIMCSFGLRKYVGMRQSTEGNILIIGSNGSGKSACIAMPTLITWQGAMCITDIKGELSAFYARLYEQGLVKRPYIVFDPMHLDGIWYDPFAWVLQDSEDNMVSNIWEIVIAIIPTIYNAEQPFWVETEQGILAAALLYYCKLKVGFIDAVTEILTSSITDLSKKIPAVKDVIAEMFLGEVSKNKEELLAAVDRGMRNKLMLFATDPHICNAFSDMEKKERCFTWNDLDTYNIFLCIPSDKIEEWGGSVNLMYTQLIRYLERKPDKYSYEGRNNVQTLLLMDEFARFGKLEMITSAVSTLRSKNVNICLVIQSIAQLDKVYGQHERRIIFDNCQYKAILGANDAETQKYLSDLIGTRKSTQWSFSENFNEFGDIVGYGRQMSETREPIVYPHELAMLEDILLLTPYGVCRVEKYRLYENAQEKLLPIPNVIQTTTVPLLESINNNTSSIMRSKVEDKEGGTKRMSIEERIVKRKKFVAKIEQQKRLELKKERDEKRKQDQRRNYIIGELVTKYFPEVIKFEQGTKIENTVTFEPLETFLSELAADQELMKILRERVASKIKQSSELERCQSSNCPDV